MRKLMFFTHTTLDGFVAGPNGEMDWIRFDEVRHEFVGMVTAQADTALYGRVTYQMMESYWPTAAAQANATKHDIEHANWYNSISKIVLSRTLTEPGLTNTKVISNHLSENIKKIKDQPGKNILIYGSPRATQSLLNEQLVDEFWLWVNPVVLGQGVPLFNNLAGIIKLKLLETKTFDGGLIALHYAVVPDQNLIER